MKRKKLRSIPSKNYLLCLFVLIAVVFLTFWLAKWYRVSQLKDLETSPLMPSVMAIPYTELDNALVETSADYFVYFSVTKDQAIYNLEGQLKNIIANYNIANIFYYVDMTLYQESPDFLITFQDKFGLSDVNSLPVLLYFQDGVLKDYTVGSTNNPLSIKKIIKLLNKYHYDSEK